MTSRFNPTYSSQKSHFQKETFLTVERNFFAFNHQKQPIFTQNGKLDANIFAFSFPLLVY